MAAAPLDIPSLCSIILFCFFNDYFSIKSSMTHFLIDESRFGEEKKKLTSS